MSGRPLVEILYFDGCPNHHPAIALVERLSGELGIEPNVQLVNVPDQQAAQRLRFLGSPTVRVGGLDVDPQAEERHDYALSCRIFRTDTGFSGQPDERWVRDALLRGAGHHMSAQPEPVEVVQRALASARIPLERFGPARLAQLNDAERALYRWILAAFAAATPPQVDELCDRASELGLQIEETLDLFAKLDLVHHDSATGEIVVAYPFSARPRGHSVLINNADRVEAMCAIDALGIAAMLGLPVEVASRDPLSGAEIWVRVDPGEGAWWEPSTAVVFAGSACCEGPSFRGCCDVLNFFATNDSANRYLATHPELSGFPISIPAAIEAGRIVFADLMREG